MNFEKENSALYKKYIKLKLHRYIYIHRVKASRRMGKKEGPDLGGNQGVELAHTVARLGRKARLNLAPPFHFLITRLIHPVTYVTILPLWFMIQLTRWSDWARGRKEDSDGACEQLINVGRASAAQWATSRVSVFIKSAVWVKPRFIDGKQCWSWIRFGLFP